MARNYRTASAAPLDYMYQINTPLMERALMANDRAITENLNLTEKLGELSYYNYIQGDEEDATAITNGYMKQINSIADTIRKDPANWRKQMDSIRAVKDKLRQDYTSGAISKQVANYNKRATDFAAIDKQVELYHSSGGTKGINSNDAMLMKQKLDSKFNKTGYDATTGSYKPYVGGSFMDDMDIKGELSKGIEKMKASGQIVESPTQAGMYLIKTEQGMKGVTPERVMQAMKGNFSPQLMNYLRERSDIGSLNGVFQRNDDGSLGDFIEPYNINPILPTESETAELRLRQAEIDKLRNKDPQKAEDLQKQLDADANEIADRRELQWENSNPLARIMQGIISENSWMETTNKTEIKADPVRLPVWKQQQTNANAAAARAVQMAGIRSREREGALNRQSRENMTLAGIEARKEKDIADRIFKIKNNPNLKQVEKDALINEEQGVDNFIRDPQMAFDPSDMLSKSQQYTTLLAQQQRDPKSITPELKEDLQQLDLMFSGIAKNLQITPQQLKDVIAYNNGDMFGSVKKSVYRITSGGTTAGSSSTSMETTYTHKYKQVKELADKIVKNEKSKKSSINNLAQVLAANININDLAYAPSRNTKEGAYTLDLVDKLFSENIISRNYYKAGETYYDKDGKLKPSNYVGEIDTPVFDGYSDKEAGRDPLKYLVAKRGGKPTDYLKDIKVKVDGNKLIVSGSLSSGGKSGNKWWRDDIDDGDIEDDAKRFQVVFDDFESGIKEVYGNSNTFRKSPSGQAFLDRTNPTLAITDNKVKKALPYLLNKGQKQEINGIKIENIGSGFKVSVDGGKTYFSKMKLDGTDQAFDITSPEQLKAIILDN